MRKKRKQERRGNLESGYEGEHSIFCEQCGAANADAELGLCPNCLGDVWNGSDNDDAVEMNIE